MEVGNTVVVDGKSAKITGRHAAGKHVQWTLDDGRTITDLHLNKSVQVSRGAKVAPRGDWKKPLPVIDVDREGAIGEDLND